MSKRKYKTYFDRLREEAAACEAQGQTEEPVNVPDDKAEDVLAAMVNRDAARGYDE